MDTGGKKQPPPPPPPQICMTNLLPDDCLCLILEKLDTKTNRDCFGLTCHRFLGIQNSSRKYLTTRSGCSSSKVDILLNRFTQLRSLDLTHCSDFLAVTKLQLHGSLLHSLNLSYCDNLNDKSIESVASGCPRLSIIRLCESDVTDDGISLLNLNCRQLTSLTITGCKKIVGVSFRGFPPTLVSLEAGYCQLDPTCVSGVLSRGSLEHLDISDPLFPGYALHGVAFGSAGANLKILNFKRCDLVNDDAVIKISKGCPLLQEWNLSCCDKITLPGWKSISSHCQNLRTLHVDGCHSFVDEFLLTLGNGCYRLFFIHMLDCSSVTEQGIQSFKTQRPFVVIYDCISVAYTPLTR